MSQYLLRGPVHVERKAFISEQIVAFGERPSLLREHERRESAAVGDTVPHVLAQVLISVRGRLFEVRVFAEELIAEQAVPQAPFKVHGDLTVAVYLIRDEPLPADLAVVVLPPVYEPAVAPE